MCIYDKFFVTILFASIHAVGTSNGTVASGLSARPTQTSHRPPNTKGAAAGTGGGAGTLKDFGTFGTESVLY